MYKLAALTRYQIVLITRNFKAVSLALAMPIVMFIIFATIMDGNLQVEGMSFVDLIVPAFMGIIIVNAVLVLFGHYYVVYREQGNYTKYRLKGISSVQVSLSIFIPIIVLQVIAAIVLVLVGVLYKDIVLPINNLPAVFMGFILVNFYQYSLVYFLSAIINKSTTYQSVSTILFNIQMFVGGLTFPVELFPAGIRDIVYFIVPIANGADILKGTWSHNKSFFDFPSQITILLIYTITQIIIARIIFRKKRCD